MTVERIEQCFAKLKQKKKTALVAYLTLGEPSIEESIACARTALEAGADLLELGVPFSDPVADGPVIAAASYRAIGRGASLRAALLATQQLRTQTDAPIVLFTYYNPVFVYGDERLPEAAALAGADGLLVVDLPPEEGASLRAAADAARIGMIPLLAPTTEPARETLIYRNARGFLYYVSVTGVTGTANARFAEAGRQAAALGARAGLPVVVGFGVRTAQNARELAEQGVDGVVVGTELIQRVSQAATPAERLTQVRELVSELRAGLDATWRKPS